MSGLTNSTQLYIHTFNGFVNQFLVWGKYIFFTLLTVNIVWLAIGHVAANKSVAESMTKFVRQFFVIALFYTLMVNTPWLTSMLDSAVAMGSQLNHLPVDPSSLISDGIGLGNKILQPLNKMSLLTNGAGMVLVYVVYLIIMFVYISVALNLALTLIMTTALISISTFFLGFSALGATTQIARQTLDVILANCVKILGIYLVVACGSQTMMAAAALIPSEKIINMDPYVWLVADAGLFWLIAKNLPEQLAKIISGAFQDSKGTDVAALAVAAISYARMAMPGVKMATTAAGDAAKLATSIGVNAAAHGSNGIGAAVTGSMKDLGGAMAGSVSDRFKSMAGKSFKDAAGKNAIPSVAERMYQGTQNVKASMGCSKTSKPNK